MKDIRQIQAWLSFQREWLTQAKSVGRCDLSDDRQWLGAIPILGRDEAPAWR